MTHAADARDAGVGAVFVALTRCGLCGADRSSFSTVYAAVPDLDRPQDHYAILRCGECGLGATDPQPTYGTLAALYRDGASSDYEYPD